MPDEARSPEWAAVDKATDELAKAWRAYRAAWLAYIDALRVAGATSQGSVAS